MTSTPALAALPTHKYPQFLPNALQLVPKVTVNNQIVVGTLMNLCDDPGRVSDGGAWRENDTLRRIPIIVTGVAESVCFVEA